VCIEFWLRFEAQIRPTRFSINFLFITGRVERKVRLCVNCLIYFLGEYSSFDVKFVAFWPKFSPYSYVEFQEKIISRIFFWNFVKNQGYPLVKFVKFGPPFCNFIMCWKIALKNSHKYFHVLFSPCSGGTSINKSQKEDIGKKSQDILFSENRYFSLSVWVLLRPIPWVFWYENFTRHSSLCVLSFGWDLSHRYVPQDFQ